MSQEPYPFERPEGPFHLGLRPLPRRRACVAAIGALAAPRVLVEMFGTQVPARIEPAWLLDHAVVWSAHVCAGYVPATVLPRPGRARIHLSTLPAAVLRLLDRREGVPWVYRRIGVRVADDAGTVHDAHAYASMAGPLRVDGLPVACAHAPFEGEPLPVLDQRTLLDPIAWNVGLASGAVLAELLGREPRLRRAVGRRLRDLRAGPFAGLLDPAARRPRGG